MRVLVMGGTRFMGLAVVGELLDRGYETIVFNRGTRTPPWGRDVEAIYGDRDRAEDLVALEGLALDAVIDLSAYRPEQTALLLEVVGDVPHFVHCSTGAVYAPQSALPWPETTPYGPWTVWGEYARAKLACEKLLVATRSSSDATTLLRPPFVLGPANYVPREEFVLNRLLDDAEILLPGDGKAVQHFVSTKQIAEMFVNALERRSAGGIEAYNVAPHGNLASLEGFVLLCAEVAEREPRVRRLGRAAEERPFDPAECVFPFPNENYVLDGRAAEAAGIAPQDDSVRAMISRALESLVDAPDRRLWTRTAAELEYLRPADA
jgi:nucleoside-diphosphate-sugar epimerase